MTKFDIIISALLRDDFRTALRLFDRLTSGEALLFMNIERKMFAFRGAVSNREAQRIDEEYLGISDQPSTLNDQYGQPRQPKVNE